MSEEVMIMMIGISTLLGALGLLGLIWAVRQGHFDDHQKFIDAVRHDNEEDLQDAVMMEEKKKRALEKKRRDTSSYRPPD